jgi:hypothetical protein
MRDRLGERERASGDRESVTESERSASDGSVHAVQVLENGEKDG